MLRVNILWISYDYKRKFKLASNANLHKFADFYSFVTIFETVKTLVGGIPPNPEIATCGDGCAFRWNAEKANLYIAENEKTLCEWSLKHIEFFIFRLPGKRHNFFNISLWLTAILLEPYF